jgi:hypothetical protein
LLAIHSLWYGYSGGVVSIVLKLLYAFPFLEWSFCLPCNQSSVLLLLCNLQCHFVSFSHVFSCHFHFWALFTFLARPVLWLLNNVQEPWLFDVIRVGIILRPFLPVR